MKKDTQEFFLHSRYTSLGETLGVITHQWKQPLNAIVSIQNRIKASLLYNGEIPNDKLSKLVDASYDIARHLSDTIDVFYGFLLPKSDAKKLFCVVEEIDNIRRLTEYSFENSDIEFLFDIRSNPKLYGNAGEFTHAILNIVLNAKNALDASKNKNPKISISIDIVDENCLIVIEDTAGGIAIKPIEKVFDLYVSSKEEGGGLGLFITKKIIKERFGGEVVAQNAQEGAIFTVSIPISRDDNDIDIATIGNESTMEYVKQLTRKVTELEEIEKTLRRWSDIFYAANWGIAVENIEEGTFESVNRAFTQMYGYSSKELNGMSVKAIFSNLCQIKGQHCSCHGVHIRKDGSSFYVEMECMEIKNESGESLYRVYNVWDITERKRIENDLQTSEKKYRSLVKNLPDNVVRWDRDGRYIFLNIIDRHEVQKALKDLTLGKRVGEIYPDGRYTTLERALDGVLSTKQSTIITRMFVPMNEDRYELHDVKLVPEFDENGELVSVLGLGRDMTDFYLLQDRIFAKEKEFRSLAENSPDSIIRYDREGRIRYLNSKLEHELGYTAAELDGKLTKDVWPDGRFADIERAVLETIADGETRSIIIYAKVNVPGALHHQIRIAAEKDVTGEIIGAIAFGRDITEIVETELRLRHFIENIPGCAFTYSLTPDGESSFPYLSQRSEELFGFSSETAKENFEHIYNCWSPEDRVKIEAAIKESANTMNSFHIEALSTQPNSPGRWLDIRSVPERQADLSILWYGIMLDITERKRAEEALYKREQEFHSLAENTPDNIARWDRNGHYFYVNPTHQRTLGKSVDEIIGKSCNEVFPDGRYASVDEAMVQIVASGKEVVFARSPEIRADGETRWHEVKLVPEFDENGCVVSVLGIGRDMTDTYRMQDAIKQREQEFRSLADNIPDNVVRWDTKGRYLYINAVKEKFMREKINKEVFGKTLGELYPNGEYSWMEEAIFTVIADKKELRLPRQPMQKPSGNVEIHDIKLVPEFNDDGELVSVLGIGRDITEQNSLLYYDPLTSLPNRALAKELGDQLIYSSKNEKCKVLFILVDIDNFNAINNSLGYEAGNEVIKSIASRLKESISEADIISRYAGDEFLIVLKNVFDTNDIVSATNKTINVFEKPFELDGHIFSLSVSIGVSFFPDFGDGFCELFQKAEIAMYSAKKDGKNTYHIYNESMDKNQIEHLELNNKIKDGIKNNEFTLHYQPQIDLSQNRIVGVEALIRWCHPELGMIPPSDFIPVAELSGLIVSLGEWVIKEACRQASEWKKDGIDICVAVNISAVQFKRGNLKEVVSESLDSFMIHPSCLELELTESILMHDAENMLLAVQELKDLGVQFSIDDFGTGYSSLAYLKRFAVDKLKIDRSFVADILHDKDDAAIANTIIQMAKNLGLRTIAEGVESREIVDTLMDYGCDEIQGYYFAKPMEAENFAMFYRDYSGA